MVVVLTVETVTWSADAVTVDRVSTVTGVVGMLMQRQADESPAVRVKLERHAGFLIVLGVVAVGVVVVVVGVPGAHCPGLHGH